MSRGAYGVGVVVALVLVAGCSGLVGDRSPTPTPLPEGEPTTTLPEGSGPSAIVEPPLETSLMVQAHRDRLRAAGNVTVYRVENVTRRANGSRRRIREVGRYDLETGAALVIHNRSGPYSVNWTTYRDPDGRAYSLAVEADGSINYLSPERAFRVNVSSALESELALLADQTNLTYLGNGSRAGVTGYVYEADDTDAPSDRLLAQLNLTRDRLRSYEYRLVLARTGRVKYVELSVVARTPGGVVRLERRSRYVAVGSTDVSRPGWVSKAAQGTASVRGRLSGDAVLDRKRFSSVPDME